MALEEIDESSIPENARLIGSRSIQYDLTNCTCFEESSDVVYESVKGAAPEGARFFIIGKSEPNRPARMGFLGPLRFTTWVNFYSKIA